jgi:hypothetical protein
MRIRPHPILHVGRFARVRHATDVRTPTVTHVVQTYRGRAVYYWRCGRAGWWGTFSGPEWWAE